MQPLVFIVFQVPAEEPGDVQIWLLTLYDKDETRDLSAGERRLLKAAIEEETRQRARLRGSRGK